MADGFYLLSHVGLFNDTLFSQEEFSWNIFLVLVTHAPKGPQILDVLLNTLRIADDLGETTHWQSPAPHPPR